MTKQINQKDLKKIRAFFHKKQNKGKCPILKMEFAEEDMVCDHAHPANSRNLDKSEEAGLIRGIIHRSANAVEGKISNSFIRTGLHKMGITLPEFLRNLADFLENPPMIHLKYMHPNEKKKALTVSKRSINKLIKRFTDKYPNKKLPEVLIFKQKKTKSGKMKDKPKRLTSGLEKLYTEFHIEPEFLKGK